MINSNQLKAAHDAFDIIIAELECELKAERALKASYRVISEQYKRELDGLKEVISDVGGWHG